MGNSPGDENISPVIRVYDEASNLIETHEQAGPNIKQLFHESKSLLIALVSRLLEAIR
jgi:hypothetical protein